jgi:ribosome biogenesis GTPase / thiamine phosphate phosphatase
MRPLRCIPAKPRNAATTSRAHEKQRADLPMSKKKRKNAGKIRADFRKGYNSRQREPDLTRDYQTERFDGDRLPSSERVSGKGNYARKRTIIGSETDDPSGLGVQLDVDLSECLRGRVLRVHGLTSIVVTDDGRTFHCITRRLLKTLASDQRHVVAAGDIVMFRPESETEGLISRIEPRSSVLSREVRGQQHVIVANVDQLVIVTSAAEPTLKPNLIDRYLVTAEKHGIEPLICINKIDLIDAADLQPLVGVYSQMGYAVLLVSAETGVGIARLKARLQNKASAVAGQSGVGKSSLLNCIEPDWKLRVQQVSQDNQKGKHTTTTADLIPLAAGGYVIDTPGIRQFQLWDVVPQEVSGYYRDLRTYVSNCRYPDCTHQHEDHCAVKDAVADGRIDLRRYESYCHLFSGE